MKISGEIRSGFTLIELLVVITVIGILSVLAVSVSQSVINSGRKITEINAAKNLLTAYAAAASDRNGQFLPGYDRTVGSVNLPDGSVLSGPAAERYPYRLAPYFGYQMKGSILVNKNMQQIDNNNTYLVSCYPAFAINYIFVGGDVSATGDLTYSTDCATTQARAGSSTLVFASAAGSGTGTGGDVASSQQINGYCILTPPNLTSQIWKSSQWTKTASPADYGNVDARYNGQAVCGFLDGSVRMLSVEELRDMRLWSSNAAQQNDPNYMVAQAARGGRL